MACAPRGSHGYRPLIDVDKNVAIMSVKIDDNSQKIDELHSMLKPMWEDSRKELR